jgi:hypothetical protein
MQLILVSELKLHQRRCAGDHPACAGCGEHFTRDQLMKHEPICLRLATAQETQDSAAIGIEAGVLTEDQFRALEHVVKKAKSASTEADKCLITRLRPMGYDEHHLLSVKKLIRRHAPLIIHVDLSIRKSMISDTHYRNQFETGTSCGSLSAAAPVVLTARKLFNNVYTAATQLARRSQGRRCCLELRRQLFSVEGDCAISHHNRRLRHARRAQRRDTDRSL